MIWDLPSGVMISICIPAVYQTGQTFWENIWDFFNSLRNCYIRNSVRSPTHAVGRVAPLSLFSKVATTEQAVISQVPPAIGILTRIAHYSVRRLLTFTVLASTLFKLNISHSISFLSEMLALVLALPSKLGHSLHRCLDLERLVSLGFLSLGQKPFLRLVLCSFHFSFLLILLL